jgi:hypothetical protein
MGDMTVGGDISWKELKKLQAQNTLVMVMGRVYAETEADSLEMRAESFPILKK